MITDTIMVNIPCHFMCCSNWYLLFLSEMPGINIDVSLAEALEVRGGPLVEPELWAVLCQSAEAIHDLFLNGV